MIKITSDPDWFNVSRDTGYGLDGDPEIRLNIYPGMKITEAKRQIDEIYKWYLEQQQEDLLRKKHPGLQAAWEQYQLLKALVKDETQV